MRILITTLTLAGVILAGIAWAAVPEGEPNDDPTANDYAGDVGVLAADPIVVDGTVASYGQDTNPPFPFTGDQDFHRFSVPEPGGWVGATLRGFAGAPTVGIFDTSFASKGTSVNEGSVALVPAVLLDPGDYYVFVAGPTGPDNDPYTLTIGGFRITKAKAKYHGTQPDRDSAKITADLPHDPPGFDIPANGLTLNILGNEFVLTGSDFTPKGLKLIHKGQPGAPLKKVIVDSKKGRIVITLKKADLGDLPASNAVPVLLQSGEVLLADRVTATQNKKGTTLKFKRK